MSSATLPPLAVTCGDPSGIGLEVVVSAWDAIGVEVPYFVIADPDHLPEDARVTVIEDPAQYAADTKGGLCVLSHRFPSKAPLGAPRPENAQSVIDVIRRGVDLVQSGAASALCTAPISKKQLVDHAGFTFPGHTEFLAHLSGAELPVMMLASDVLKVVPATIHIPLKDVPLALTSEGLEATIRTVHAGLIRDFAIAAPRIAVAGLNPHAGEGGMLGGEEISLITPICDRLRAEGMNIAGPLSADTMFHAKARAGYDAAIAMYHDQALVPIKTLAFDEGVNVTLGLPFVRTSPDHGTAFDIAGKGVANPGSMIEALRLAWSMAQARAGQAL